MKIFLLFWVLGWWFVPHISAESIIIQPNYKVGIYYMYLEHFPKTYTLYQNVHFRGGVKLEFVRNLFDSIRKFAIRLIRKRQKIYEKFDEN